MGQNLDMECREQGCTHEDGYDGCGNGADCAVESCGEYWEDNNFVDREDDNDEQELLVKLCCNNGPDDDGEGSGVKLRQAYYYMAENTDYGGCGYYLCGNFVSVPDDDWIWEYDIWWYHHCLCSCYSLVFDDAGSSVWVNFLEDVFVEVLFVEKRDSMKGLLP